jgi:hypothetical protein
MWILCGFRSETLPVTMQLIFVRLSGIGQASHLAKFESILDYFFLNSAFHTSVVYTKVFVSDLDPTFQNFPKVTVPVPDPSLTISLPIN